MKTSNKLLGLVLVLVLGIPVLLGLSFRRSIREGIYTLENFDHLTVSKGVYKPYKTIKITAPVPDVLKCHLLPSGSDSLQYSYTKYYGNGSPDSVRVYNSGDTLYIQYMGGKRVTEYKKGRLTSSKIQYTKVDVDLHLPYFNDIVVDMGSVVIDSLGKSAKFSLFNLGELHLAESGTRTITRQRVITETEEGVLMPIDSTFSGDFPELDIATSNGRLFIGGNAWIQNIKLDLQGPSYLSINDNARVDQVKGHISARTSITAHPKNMRKLETLISK